MSLPQPGVLPDGTAVAATLIFDLEGAAHGARAAVRRAAGVAALPTEIGALTGEELTCTIGFGPAAWRAARPDLAPALLTAFPGVGGPNHSVPATGGDLCFHMKAARPDLLWELADRIHRRLADSARAIEEVHGFRYLDSRDLTGFVDGTANPEGDERAAAALVGAEDPDFLGGSYLLVQRWVHDLTRWRALSVSDQQEGIGRTKADDVELGEAAPPTAHIQRVEIEEDGRELAIYRQSFPYGPYGSELESGLQFVAYCRRPMVFQRMLENMVGASEDGLQDGLLDFTRAVSGAWFFAPSQELIARLAR